MISCGNAAAVRNFQPVEKVLNRLAGQHFKGDVSKPDVVLILHIIKKKIQRNAVGTNCVRAVFPLVNQLAEYASQKGTVSAVVHSAGISPNMGTVDTVFNINALGTIYMNEAFKKVMPSGGCIIDVSSMSAYLLPFIVLQNPITNKDYALCMTDIDAFQSKLLDFIGTLPGELQAKVSYALFKHFVIWYAAQCACIYGRDGIRVLSISPGTFDTPLGNKEGPHAASYALNGALGRVGKPKEVAQLMAFCASDAASYITGIDILCDGGTMAALKQSMENRG